MTHAQDVMTPAQMAALVNTAFAMRHPLTYLDTTMSTFRAVGRDADAHVVALIGCLYAEREIELLMRLKAAWKLGQAMDPESVIRPEMRRQR